MPETKKVTDARIFCANCGQALETVDDILSQDLDGGDYYTHYCPGCKTYWHLHIHGGGVDLISTRSEQQIASKSIKDNLLLELKNRVSKLEKIG